MNPNWKLTWSVKSPKTATVRMTESQVSRMAQVHSIEREEKYNLFHATKTRSSNRKENEETVRVAIQLIRTLTYDVYSIESDTGSRCSTPSVGNARNSPAKSPLMCKWCGKKYQRNASYLKHETQCGINQKLIASNASSSSSISSSPVDEQQRSASGVSSVSYNGADADLVVDRQYPIVMLSPTNMAQYENGTTFEQTTNSSYLAQSVSLSPYMNVSSASSVNDSYQRSYPL